MPVGFTYPGENTEIWIPHVIAPEELGKANFSYDAVGRLKPGVSVEATNEELGRLLKRMPEIYPGELTAGLIANAQLTPYISPLIDDIVGDVSQVQWILLGTVSFVLLIACANVANSRLGKPPPLAVRLEEAMPSRRAVLKCLQRLRGYVTGRGALWSYRGSAPLFRWLTT